MSVVYFIQQGSGPVKIGVAARVSSRFSSIQSHNPFPLRVRTIIPGSFKLEETLHNYFSEARCAGEWFDPLQDDDLEVFMRSGLVRLAQHILLPLPTLASAILDLGFIPTSHLDAVQRASKGMSEELIAEVPDAEPVKVNWKPPAATLDKCACGGLKRSISRRCFACYQAESGRIHSRYRLGA